MVSTTRSPADPQVSILVVSHRTRELTLACLESLARARNDAGTDREVFLVDNASDDGTAAAVARGHPDVRLIESRENLGFARACNLAAADARGEFLLLLNPDTLVPPDAIARLLACARRYDGGRGIFGGRTLHPDGSLNPGSCWSRPTLWSTFCLGLGLSTLGRWIPALDPETLPGWKRDSEREVDIVSGCFLLIRRDLWEALGGFDPRFFLYGEDFDLCLRARAAGIPRRICPEAEIVHHGGKSERVKADQLVNQMRARVQLLRKHWSPPKARLGWALLRLRVAVRALGFPCARALGLASPEVARGWLEAWRRRAEWSRPGA